MNRRRLLVVSLSLAAGCTGTDYRASGPRTPPTAPATTESRSTLRPADARAQTVVRPLNELYRSIRPPLGSFEVADVSAEQLADAEASLAAARRALSTATADGLPAGYGSLPRVVEAHAHLLEALSAAVTLYETLRSVFEVRVGARGSGPSATDTDGDDAVDGDSDPTVDTARRHLSSIRDAAAALSSVAADEPSVPNPVFLTTDRMRSLADVIDEQARGLATLLDALDVLRSGDTAWDAGVAALDDGSYETARARFETADRRYEQAQRTLESLSLSGSFDDLADRADCATDAGADAVELAAEAVSAAAAGDGERASELRSTAHAERSRCGSD